MTENEQNASALPMPTPPTETAAPVAAAMGAAQMLTAEEAAKFKHNRKYSPHAGQSIENIGDIPNDAWVKKRHWSDTPTGRAGIEFIARITLGGMFFALMGQSKTAAALNTYDPSTHTANPNKTILEKIAYGIDQTIGKVMHQGFKTYYGGDAAKADAAIRFRQTRNTATGQTGRSLGAEMTVVTADFAAMSAGTAIAREALLTAFNPNERSAWLKDGHFSLSHFGKRLLSKAWEIISYNAGEDAAVALPYVFFLRGCRNFIDKRIAPGFRYGSDHVDNGGSIVVDGEGYARGELQVAGALDLQARFTVYNVFTQIYRDWYNDTAKSLKKWRENGFELKAPEWVKDPTSIPERMVDYVKGTSRYLAISSIRSILQMTPSVPFFSIIRAPQSKPQGLAVHPEFGMLLDPNGTPLRRDQRAGTAANDFYKVGSNAKISWSNLSESDRIARGLKEPNNPFADLPHSKYDIHGFAGPGRPLFYSGVSNATDKLGTTIHDLSRQPIWQKGQQWFWNLTGNGANGAELSRQAALAGMPYASYFAAKVFFREQYVNEQMNIAIGRALDGVLSFNMRETAEGLSEIQRTMMGLPFKDPERQAELIENHRYHPSDKSPIPDNWDAKDHKQYLEAAAKGEKPSSIALTSKIIQKRADDYASKAEKMSPQPRKGWAAQQRALAEEQTTTLSAV